MNYLGIDLGTSTISFILAEDSGDVLKQMTLPNTANISGRTNEYLQDPDVILSAVSSAIREVSEQFQIDGIGITGQMHGILYIDEDGNSCSNLYTWEDQRGNELFQEDLTYADLLKEKTGYSVSSGFGSLSLFYDTMHGTVPKQAKKICTIADFIAMKLGHLTSPQTHLSNAASLGLFDLRTSGFDFTAIEKAGMNSSLFPEVCSEKLIGCMNNGIPLSAAIGDNQASFFGSVNGHSSTLINIGTGSQISVLSDQIISHRLLDCRPYLNGNYLLVGASLCGGRAYKILRDFFQSVIRMAGAQVPENLYAFMDAQAGMYTDTELRVDSRFSGTRIDPSLRGSIQNISDRNLTAGSLSFATLNGICTELYEFYQSVPENLRANDVLIGSGNGIRNSSVEREIIRKIFSRKLVIPKCSEEAAYGAALMAMYNSGKHSMEEIRNMISYEAEQD